MQSSHRRLHFQWRGKYNDHRVNHGDDDDDSYIKFLSNGDIEGQIDVHGEIVKFAGRRVSDQPTKSEIGAVSMKRQWRQVQ